MDAGSRVASTVGAVALVLLLVPALVVEAVAEETLTADLCYLGVLIGASVAAWVGVRRWAPERRAMSCLIAAGISLNALGEVVWTVLDRTGHDPDVSVADLAWFSSYVCLCGALWVVLRRSRSDGRADLGFVVDAVTIVVVSVLVFWRVSVAAIVDDTTLTPFVRAVWASYPVLDAVLLALVVRILLSRRARAAVDVWFAVGVCLWLTADVLYLRIPESADAAVVMNLAWMVAPVAMARAAWAARDVAPLAPREPGSSAGWVAQLTIAVGPLFVPSALEVVADVRGQAARPGQLLVGTVVLVALAFVRTGRLIRSEQQALRDLEAARDAALAASQAKSMFLANISHELRTPLTTVVGAAELLTETALDARQRKLLEMTRRSGRQLRTLVEDILDFSRIEAGQAVLHPAEFDLPELVTEIVDTHLPRAEQQLTALEWSIDPRVPLTVLGDRTRVFQVLNNLVGNALKFTECGSVRLDVRPVEGDPTTVQFTVRDTGIGIREEDQATVFESFRQVDGSASRRYEGTGLGLAICKELTQLMRGTITLRSALGAGSTFTVRLPLAAVDGTVDGCATTDERPRQDSNLRPAD